MTVAPEVRCPVCDSPASRHLPATISPFLRERCRLPPNAVAKSHLCDVCEHVFLTPFLDKVALRLLYQGYRGDEYNDQRLKLEPDYTGYVGEFSDEESSYFRARRTFYDQFHADRFNLEGLVVDAGDGGGYFGRYAYPHSDVVTLARTEPTPGVALTDLMGAADVLFLAHALQQVPRPRSTLRRLTAWMRPGAEVWIETPVQYFGSLQGAFRSLAELSERGARPSGPLVTLHENLAHFSPRSLKRLCEGASLTPREFVRSDIGVLGVLATRSDIRLDRPHDADDRVSAVFA